MSVPPALTLLLSVVLLAGCSQSPSPAPGAAPSTAPPGSTASVPTPGTPAPGTPPPASPAPSASTPAPPSASASASPARLEMPRGGTTVFPRYRLVGYAGVTGYPPLGRLGIGNLDKRVDELERLAKPYGGKREVLPVLEIIATIVQASPGADGKYRTRLSDPEIRRYLKAARAHRAVLLLNIQPGRARFLDEVKAYDRWLAEPDVGLALDPEWAMGPGQVPGRTFGRTTGKELDQVAQHVSRLVARKQLPEKVVVYHQLTRDIVGREQDLRDRPGVVLVKSIDGIGSRAAKIDTYDYVNKGTPRFVHPGFKIFFEEDAESGPVMTPKQVLALDPVPDYVMYE